MDLKAELIKGSNGIFEIAVDGVVVAKKSFGQFPDDKTIVDAVSKAIK